MIVTKIESITSTKYRVFVDEQFAFVLYKGELFKYNIKSGEEISDELIVRIKNEILTKRAKLRAMHLLNASPRTEQQLREKLCQSEYPTDVIEEAISYVKSFGYINDEAYIRNMILCKRGSKSKREIQMILQQKGLDKDQVELLLDEAYEEETEADTIREILRKKRWNPEELDEKGKQKMYAYLMRKGFRYFDICQAIQNREYL